MRDYRPWIVLLRLTAGFIWLFEAYPHVVDREAYLGGGFAAMVQSAAAGHPMQLYADFLQRVVIPSAGIFAYLSLVGSLFVGVGLVLGLLTPYACLTGLVLSFIYALGSGWMNRDVAALNILLIVSMAILLALRAGQTAGVDVVLERRGGRRREYRG